MTLDTQFDPSFDDLALDALDTLDSFTLGTVSLMKADERTRKTQGFGATMGAQAVVKKYLEETVVNVKAHHEASLVGRQGDGVKDLMEILSTMEPELVALVALQVGLETVANGQGLSKAFFALGKAVEHEAWAHALKTQDKKLAARIEKLGKRRASLGARRTAVKKIAAANDFQKEAWTRDQHTIAGKWMVEVLLMGSAFVRVDEDDDGKTIDSYLTITGEALDHSEAITKSLLESHPIPLPLLTPPKPWDDVKTTIDCNGRGYNVPLLRRNDKITKAHLLKAHKAGALDRVYAALNAIQEVPWSINQNVVEMIRWAYQNDIKVEGLPPRLDYQIADVCPTSAPVGQIEGLHERRMAGSS